MCTSISIDRGASLLACLINDMAGAVAHGNSHILRKRYHISCIIIVVSQEEAVLLLALQHLSTRLKYRWIRRQWRY